MNLFRPPSAFIAAALLGFAVALNAAPATTNAAPRPQPARWLLIVDTSSGMEKRADAVRGVVGEMVSSGMNGQMQPGDEFGIWTYNKKLSAGVAPMQTWDASRSNTIAGRTVAFLDKQSYTGKAKPELVFAALEPIVSSSRQLTVVMLSDGAVDVAGTPFDAAINAAYAEHRPALKKSRMPLVTVLRGYKGNYFAQQVSVAPWITEFPAFPAEPVKTNLPPVVEPPKPAPKRTIIIRPEPKKVAEVEPAVALQPGAVTLRNLPETTPDVKPAVIEPLPTPANVNLTPVVTPVVTPATVPADAIPIAKVEPAPPAIPPAAPAPAHVAPVTPPVVAPAPVIAPAPAAPAQASATPASDNVTVRKWPLILGITFMWVAIVVALMLARRARRANATSIITQSFDKK